MNFRTFFKEGFAVFAEKTLVELPEMICKRIPRLAIAMQEGWPPLRIAMVGDSKGFWQKLGDELEVIILS